VSNPEAAAGESALLPCPFCGGKANHRPEARFHGILLAAHEVRCDGCSASVTAEGRSSPAIVAAAWNRRDTRAVRAEALEQAADDLEAWRRLMDKDPTLRVAGEFMADCDTLWGAARFARALADRIRAGEDEG
jgi:Lar family restriction alleviation protein